MTRKTINANKIGKDDLISIKAKPIAGSLQDSIMARNTISAKKLEADDLISIKAQPIPESLQDFIGRYWENFSPFEAVSQGDRIVYRFYLERTAEFSNYSGDLLDPRYRAALRWYDTNQGNFVINSREAREMIINSFSLHDEARDVEARDAVYQLMVKDNYFWQSNFLAESLKYNAADHAVAVRLGSDKYLEFREHMARNPLLANVYGELLEKGHEVASRQADSFLAYKALQTAAEEAGSGLLASQMTDLRKMALALKEEVNARATRTRAMGQDAITFSEEDAKMLALLFSDLRHDFDPDAAWRHHQTQGYVRMKFEGTEFLLEFHNQEWRVVGENADNLRKSVNDLNELWRRNMDEPSMLDIKNDSLRLRLLDHGRDAAVLYGQNYGNGWHYMIARDEWAIAEMFRKRLILEFGFDHGSQRFDQLMAAPRLQFGSIADTTRPGGTPTDSLEEARNYVRDFVGEDLYYELGDHPLLLTDNYGARDFILRLTARERETFESILDYWSQRTDGLRHWRHPATFWNQPNMWFENFNGLWYRCDAYGVRNVAQRFWGSLFESNNLVMASFINDGVGAAGKQLLIEQRKLAGFTMISAIQHAGKCIPVWRKKAGLGDDISKEELAANGRMVDAGAAVARSATVLWAIISVDKKKLTDKNVWIKEILTLSGNLAGDQTLKGPDGEPSLSGDSWYFSTTMRALLGTQSDVIVGALTGDKKKFLDGLMKSGGKLYGRHLLFNDLKRESQKAREYIERTGTPPQPPPPDQPLTSGEGLVATIEDLIPTDADKIKFAQHESHLTTHQQRLAHYLTELSQLATAIQAIATAYPIATDQSRELLAEQAAAIRVYMTGVIKELNALNAGVGMPPPQGVEGSGYDPYAIAVFGLLKSFLDMFGTAYSEAEGEENAEFRLEALRGGFTDFLASLRDINNTVLYANDHLITQIDGQLGNFYTDVTVNDPESGAITGSVTGAVWRDQDGKFHYTGAGDGSVWILGQQWTFRDLLSSRSNTPPRRRPEEPVNDVEYLREDQITLIQEIRASAAKFLNYMKQNRTLPTARETWILNGCSDTPNSENVQGFATVTGLDLAAITDEVRRFLWLESNPGPEETYSCRWAKLRGGGDMAIIAQSLDKAMGYDAIGSIAEGGIVRDVIQLITGAEHGEHASHLHGATGFWFRHVTVNERTISDAVHAAGLMGWQQYNGRAPQSEDRPTSSRESRYIEIWRAEGSYLDGNFSFVRVLFDDDGNPVAAGRYDRQGRLINSQGEFIDSSGGPVTLNLVHYEVQLEDGSFARIGFANGQYNYVGLDGTTVTLTQAQFEEGRAANRILSRNTTRQVGQIVQLEGSDLAQLQRILAYEALQWDGANSHDVISGDGDLFGRGGNDRLTGGEGDGQLDGGAGMDTLEGGGGNDELYGRMGDDTLVGGTGEDKLFGGHNNDLLRGEDDNDTLFGEEGNDSLYGAGGADHIYASEGDDHAYGGEGEDNLSGESGKDWIEGGTGNDIIFGGSEDDTLTGDHGADRIEAGSGRDVLFGGEDEDSLFGGSDNDVLMGGAGADSLRGDNGDDSLHGEAGQDILEGGQGQDYLVGGDDNDLLRGGGGNDILVGGNGDDTLDDSFGTDHLISGRGNDLFIFSAESADFGHKIIEDLRPEDRIHLFNFPRDHIYFSVDEQDAIIRLGNDQRTIRLKGLRAAYNRLEIQEIEGGGLEIRMPSNIDGLSWRGSEYADVIEGIAGSDRIHGDGGDDTLYGLSGADYAEGGEGQDLIYGGGEGDNLVGGEGHDRLYGEEGFDVLYGGQGNDTLDGGAGDDILRGEGGADHLIGGEGYDWADYSASSAGVIVDLAHGQGIAGDAEGDTLIGVEAIIGSNHGDRLLANRDLNSPDTISFNAHEYRRINPDTPNHPSHAWIHWLESGRHEGRAGAFTTSGATIEGRDGDDFIRGTGLSDYLIGGSGADHIHGEGGHDQIVGGDGRDTLEGGAGNDMLAGGVGDDSLFGQTGEDELLGWTGNDQLNGGEGFDTLIGGSGLDTLYGGEGEDWLLGEGDQNLLYGGSGQDRFVFEHGVSVYDIIADFSAEDLIILRGVPEDETGDLGDGTPEEGSTPGESGGSDEPEETNGTPPPIRRRPPYILSYDGQDALIGTDSFSIRVTNGRALLNARNVATYVKLEP